jgi:hypothetical protein
MFVAFYFSSACFFPTSNAATMQTGISTQCIDQTSIAPYLARLANRSPQKGVYGVYKCCDSYTTAPPCS